MRRERRRVVRFGRYEFDVDQQQLYRSGLRVRLAPQPTRLLGLLLDRAGEIVTRNEIRSHLWPEGTWVDHQHGINQSIRSIRAALGDDALAGRFVETVPRRGYRFCGGVEAVEARPAEADLSPAPLRSPWRRGATTLSIGVAAATVLLLLGGIGIARRSATPSLPQEQDLPRLQRLTSNGATWAAAISPDGRRLAYALPEDGGYVVRLKTLSTGHERRIVEPTPFPIKAIDFSPAGRQIYFVREATRGLGYRKLYRYALDRGETEELVFDVDSGVACSPDGSRLAFVRGYPRERSSKLIEADSDGRGEAVVAEWHAPDFLLPVAPAWSPDGATLAVAVRHGGDGSGVEIVEIDLASGRTRPIGPARWSGVTGLAWAGDSPDLLVSAERLGTGDGAQLWRVDGTSGSATRFSNDLNGYTQISATADGDLAGIRLEHRPPVLLFRSLDGPTERWTGASLDTHAIRLLRRGPDGGAIFTASSGGRLRLWRIAGPGAQAVPLLPESVTTLGRFAVSPDGETVVYEARDVEGVPHLWKVDSRGGAPRPLTAGRGEHAPAVCTADGRVVFARLDAAGLWVVDGPGAVPRQISSLSPVGLPACSPNGESVAMATLTEPGASRLLDAVVVPVAGGEPLVRLSPYDGRDLAWSPDGRALTFTGRPDAWHTVWRVALPGGEIAPLLTDQRGQFHGHDWTTDGDRLLLNRVSTSSDAVLIGALRGRTGGRRAGH